MILNIQNAFVTPFSGTHKKSGFKKGKKKRSLTKRKIAGVYFIKEDGIIVYIGMSQSCLISALYRHFYRYSDSHRKPRTYYKSNNANFEIAIIQTSKEDAPILERGLILSVNPRDNRDKFASYLDFLSVQNIEKKIEVVEEEIITEDFDMPF